MDILPSPYEQRCFQNAPAYTTDGQLSAGAKKRYLFAGAAACDPPSSLAPLTGYLRAVTGRCGIEHG